jgi:hypothetical protein
MEHFGFCNFTFTNYFGLNEMTEIEYLQKRKLRIIKEKTKKIFDNLEQHKYKIELNKYNSNCSICLEHFCENSMIVKLQCDHIFHVNCLKTWFENVIHELKCPNCFTKIDLEKLIEENKKDCDIIKIETSIVPMEIGFFVM